MDAATAAAIAFIAFLAVFGLTVGALALLLPALRRRHILDRPNERSSHATPTPRGGGIAMIGVLLPAWAILFLTVWPAARVADAGLWWLLAGALVLAIVSWIDDLRGLGPLPRLATQIAAVAAGVWVLQGYGPVFQGLLPPWLDALAAALLWLWFVNLFNFMDGIDGLAGGEAASLGLGLFLLSLLAGLDAAIGLPGLLLAAAALGFLVWNWHPARVFMGDVGSVPLGFLIAWLLLRAAAEGSWAPALILPLYYLADATITLVRRLARGDRVWRAHREHFYQRAVQAGRSHARVVRLVLAGNAALVLLALLSARGHASWPLAAAAAVVAVLLWRMARPAGHS